MGKTFDRVWRGGALATLSRAAEGLGFVQRGAIACRGGRIIYAGPEADMPSGWDAGEVIELEGRLVTPGLVDCHTHLVFGVGTDSNIQLDAAGELRQLEYSQRLILRARNVLAPASGASTGQRLLEAALQGGAQALGLGPAGLQPGAPADFVVLEADQTDLAMVGEEHWLDAWIFALGRRGVDKVAVNGEIVVEGGRHRARDAIDARYRAAIAELSTESAP